MRRHKHTVFYTICSLVLFCFLKWNIFSSTDRSLQDRDTKSLSTISPLHGKLLISGNKANHPTVGRAINPTANSTLRRCTVEERLSYVKQKCDDTPASRKSVPKSQLSQNIFVDEKHKVLLCVPYKSGASTHLNILAQNSDAVLNHAIPAQKLTIILDKLVSAANRKLVGIRDLTSYSPADKTRLLKDYYKVAVVRHPFVRILSMYTNKVGLWNAQTSVWECSNNYYGQNLLKWMKEKHTSRGINCTFDLFIDYLVNHQSVMLKDMHTHPMDSWCHHCLTQYDMIIKLETGNDDQKILIKNKINKNFNQTLQINPALHTNKRTDFTAFWKQFHGITSENLRKLHTMYRNDLELFGYKYQTDNDGLTTSCAMNGSQQSGDKCC